VTRSSTAVTIPYGNRTVTFDVPEDNLLGVFAPRPVPPVGDTPDEILRALEEPIGGPRMEELARGKRRVVLVVDDNTRPTPAHIIVPLLLNTLNEAGVPDRAVQVVIALGTHRKMTDAEIQAKFGPEICRRVRISNHEAFDSSALVDLGVTAGGVHVAVNRTVMEADLVIGVGSIVPHHIPGFSGGAKIVQPGVCGERTTGEVHLLSVRHPHSLLGVVENRVRREMEEIAERAGLRAILNTVLSAEGEVVGAVYGDPRAAFREGVMLSRRVYGVSVPRHANIVIAGSHPCNSEFWQAHKTLYAAELVVAPGGTIIIVAPCPEGVAATHPGMLRFGGWTKERLEDGLRSGEIEDLTGAALAMAWANTRERAGVSLVSGGITPEETRALGFATFDTVDEALADALHRHGPEASVAVLPYAPDTLPLVG